MFSKYWRLRMRWEGDQTLTFNSGAAIAVRISPWKIEGGVFSYGTTITDDLGFGAGETIIDDGEVEGSVNNNTSNLYWGGKGFFKVTADVTSTDGYAYLYIEESDDNSNWPSVLADFDITDLLLVAVLPLSTDAEDEARAVPFEI
jgi:hypothetical protein